MGVTGIDEAILAYQQIAESTSPEALAGTAHDAIVADLERQSRKIGVASGALKKAMLNKRDRFHEVKIKRRGDSWTLQLLVTGNWDDPKTPLRAAIFQSQGRKRLPQADPDRVVAAVAAAYGKADG